MPLEPYARVSIKVQDAHFGTGAMSFLAPAGVTASQVEGIASLIEAVSNGKVCDYSITTPGTFSGKAAAVVALYPDHYEVARMEFTRPSDCTETANVSFPAPLTAIFTGSANRILDTSNGAVAALGAGIAAILTNKAGHTGWMLAEGYRDTVAAAKPRV